MIYLYDAFGAPIGLQYRNTTYEKDVFDTYWFEKNLQGDVVAIYNASGNKICNYIYDAWGNISATYGSGYTNQELNIAIFYNPFRYRGYYYDTETGFYYLQSRYYNPQWGRFLNADGQLNDGLLGYNMFVYCVNNPISYVDHTGECPKHRTYNNDCKICHQERVVAYLSGMAEDDESELFAPNPNRVSHDCPKPKENQNVYTSAETLVTLPLTVFGTSLGFAMKTTFEAGVAGSIGFVVSVPISVVFRWCNPDLKTGQKWVLTGYDVGIGLIGIGIGCLLAFSSVGTGAAIVITVAYALGTYYIGGQIEDSYIRNNRRLYF